ncbi:MAG: ComEA family DNA-binding protein [Chloroflexota bacterium]
MGEALRRYRGYILLSLVFAILFGAYVAYERRPQPQPIELITPVPMPTATLVPIRVDVAGAVRQPGVYALPPESRWAEAVAAAGGLAEDADRERTNLAARRVDGQQVYIPRLGQTPPPSPAVGAGGAPPATGPSGGGTRVNINTANAADLDALPGIGPALAGRIIAYRQAQGPFRTTADVMQVNGIGPACYEQIKDLIRTE